MYLTADQVAQFVDHVRTFDVREGLTDPNAGSNAADDGMTDILQDDSDSLEEADILAFLEALNDDAQAEIVALVWIGRGDFEHEEWSDAISAARARKEGPISD